MLSSTHITPSTTLWKQRHSVAKIKDRLLSLFEAVDHPTDLLLYQWVQLLSFTMEFQPDLILELGRGAGNSTCVFTEAANHIQECKVVSVCMSNDWEVKTFPRVKKIVSSDWYRPLEIYRHDILKMDYSEIISDNKKVLLFWDAHGYDVAECILGGILPQLVNCEHIVIMHDISDSRYLAREERSYKGNRLWRGNNWEGQRLMLGTIDSCVEQAVAIIDFCTRNDLTLHSADHNLHTDLGQDEEKIEEMNKCLGKTFFDDSCQAHWRWFTLNEKAGPYFFPRFD